MKALSLSGGATKGIAHIGAIRALQVRGYEFDVLIGSSVGSIIAYAYACNKLAEVRQIFVNLTPRTISSQPAMNNNGKLRVSAYLNLIRKGYMTELDNLRENIMKVVPPSSHLITGKTVFVASVDMVTGSRVVKNLNELSYHEAIDALIQSASIPVFNPLPEVGDRIYADGGLRMHNAGYWLLEHFPLKLSELVSVFTRPQKPSLPNFYGGNLFQVLSRTIDIMNVEISKNDELAEIHYAHQRGVKLTQIFVPSILKSLYDTDNTRLRELEIAAYREVVKVFQKPSSAQ